MAEISGTAVFVTLSGGILLYSAVKNNSVTTTLRSFLAGQVPPSEDTSPAGFENPSPGTGGTPSGRIPGVPDGVTSGRFHSPVGSSLRRGRTDQGVDYTGSGPLYAVASGTVMRTSGSGWPGGKFIVLNLDRGLSNGRKYVYYAEDLITNVQTGQHLNGGEIIGHATGGGNGVEIGWAAGPNSGFWGDTLAKQRGHDAVSRGLSSDPGAVPSLEGKNFLNWIRSFAQKVVINSPIPLPVGATAQQTVRNAARIFGWSSDSQLRNLTQLVFAESGWNSHIRNRSGAFGIAQALDHGNSNTSAVTSVTWSDTHETETMVVNEYGGFGVPDAVARLANAGNVAAQAYWMMAYIRHRWGSPYCAWTGGGNCPDSGYRARGNWY